MVILTFLDEFPISEKERQLEGCAEPLTFEFDRDLREKGHYQFVAIILPSQDRADAFLELQ